MQIYNDQALIINQTFKIMGMEEIIYDFNKPAPYNLNLRYHEYAPFNILLEDSCPYGNNCFDKRNPHICYKNHQTVVSVLMKYSLIPNFLCRYERPWKKLQDGTEMRCTNKYCWFSHLKGRKEILEKLFILCDTQ
jgi:hypothetical protein